MMQCKIEPHCNRKKSFFEGTPELGGHWWTVPTLPFSGCYASQGCMTPLEFHIVERVRSIIIIIIHLISNHSITRITSIALVDSDSHTFDKIMKTPFSLNVSSLTNQDQRFLLSDHYSSGPCLCFNFIVLP